MPLKILHADDAAAAASDLAARLRRWRNREITILLASHGLENAPGKNDIIREALAAANDGVLLVVRMDGAQAPVGTRDAPSADWAPDASFTPIEAAVRKIARKRKRGLPGGCLIAAIIAAGLLVLGVISLSLIGSPMYAPSEDVLGRPPVAFPEPLQAIEGRWASSSEACDADWLEIASTGAGELQTTTPAGNEIIRIVSVDAEAMTVTGADAAGSPVVYRAGSGALTIERAGESAALVNCPASELPSTSTTPEELAGASERVPNFGAEAAAIKSSIWTLEDAVQVLNDRLTLALGFLIALVVLNVLVLLGVRLPARRRRKDANAVEAKPGSVVVASYSRQDGKTVDELVQQIERGGVSIWMDRADIGAGTTWSEEIVRAIRNSRGLLLFCSSHAFESDHVLRELNLADSCRKPVFPVLLEPVPIPDSFLYYLSTRQVVDLSNDPDWRDKLAAALKPNIRQVEESEA